MLCVAAVIVGAVLGFFLRPQTPPQPETEPTPTPSVRPTPTPDVTPEAAASAEPAATFTLAPMTLEEWTERYIASMSIEEKLGQLVLFGFSGTSGADENFTSILQAYQVGNLILYGSNIKSSNSDGGFNQCAKLVERVRGDLSTEIPPLVSIDVEGGSVVRFRWSPHPVSARSLGRRRDVDYAFEQFERVGAKLASVGVNLNLAPVLDVSEDPMDTFLETRIISEDASIAAAIGGAAIDGLHAGGCLSAAKHFPGHGGTNEDSHAVTPVVRRAREELFSYDLVPFQAAVDGGVDAVLVAHILYPALDENDIASMSGLIIDGLLRAEMGFTGIVVSDDFRMSGLTSRYGVGEAAVRFVLAGGDLIMCGAEYDKQIAILDGLRAAVSDGRLSEARVNESVKRILLKKIAVTDWDIAAAAQN